MDAVIGLTGAERGFLVLLEATAKDWKLRAARNFGQESLVSQAMEVSRTVIDTVLAAGEGLITTDAQTDPRLSTADSVVFYALRSVMCAPLMMRGKAIGAIYVDNRALKSLFDQDDLQMLNAFAAQAAIAIENARLYTSTDQALTQRVAELETLANLDRELNAQLNLQHTIEIALRWLKREAETDLVWIILAEDGNLQGEVEIYPQEHTDLDDTLIAQTLAKRAPQMSTSLDGQVARLGMPILHGDKLLGAVVVEQPVNIDQGERGGFTETKVHFMGYMLNRAAAAIRNAQLYELVQYMSDAKTQFISVVAHELRVPMTSIKGYADLMRQEIVGPVNEQQISFLDIIRNNVERMSVLVSDLSDISKIESGRIKIAGALIPLKVYVDEALRALRPKLEQKEQTLEVQIPSDLPQVFADYNRVIQIITNLVVNANAYTPTGGKISVSARDQGEFVRLEVADNGIGINPQDQAKLFTQFFRSDDPVVRNEPGWGLGLSVAKRLVELLGGSIGFTSAVGEGSTFWFTLPKSESAAGN
jgi:signal transduction histidine kinase